MQHKLSKISLAVLAATSIHLSATAVAQEQDAGAVDEPEVIEVTGIRSALASALNEKRGADTVVEIIQAEDIGKLPDQNLAEVLENVTGIQITRTAGIGTGVQIRGSNANIVQINGASTVGTGDGRGGMKFEDLSAAIIAGVEVTKGSEAKTIEGVIGGTVNLRTIRPLELDETLASFRLQGEDSSLTTDGIMPRFSGAYGDNWESDAGRFGFVVSGSLTRQEASAFRPRVDRDGSLVENVNASVVRYDNDGNPVVEDQPSRRPAAQNFDFLGIQFLNQEYENFEYETKNFAGTFEFAPNNDMKFFADVILTDQEVRQESTRVQGSGVSSVLNYNVPTSFETINFGTLDGVNLGSIAAAQTGTIEPDLSVDDDDPNLRFNSDTGARVTDSQQLRFGGEWQATDDLFVSGEISYASSESRTPSLNTQLNFINPNAPLDRLDDEGNFTENTSNDNAVPFIYDLTGDQLSFGINFDSPFAPTVAQLLDPSNVVLDQVDFSNGSTDNSDFSMRVDSTYYIDHDIFTSVDFGFRSNTVEHESLGISDRIGGFSRLHDSPGGDLFSELLIAGPSNFGEADGRALALRNFLIVDPELAFSNPQLVINTLESAMTTYQAEMIALGFVDAGASLDFLKQEPGSTAGFKVEETTNALYAQVNFEYEYIRGNFGLRHVMTDIESIGKTEVNGNVSEVVNKGDYSYTLPRLNVIADVTDDLVVRLSWGQDIRRPNFGNLNTSVSFGTNENQSVDFGNPNLEPEEVTTFDLSTEWYFADSAVASIGFFQKDITNLIVAETQFAEVFASGFRDTDVTCPSGGVFNPSAQANVFGPTGLVGLCVDIDTSLNDTATITQSGIELSFQYDLSSFEDDLGWASGFGVLANYTYQDYSGGSVVNESATRGTDVFNAINGIYDSAEFVKVTSLQGLLDFSENAYNLTVYYEKHDLSARMRYTYRDAYRTLDTAAGASLNSTLGFPVTTHARGQLNASVSYDVNEELTVGVEAINLTESDIIQSCVNENAMQCAEGITDRRITFGATYRF